VTEEVVNFRVERRGWCTESFLILPLVLFLVLAPMCFGRDVPDSSEGFSEQYQAVFKAWQEGNSQALKASLGEFAIPSRWFTEAFGSELGETLASQYADEFADFETHIARNFLGGRDFAATRYGAKQRELFVETNLKLNTDSSMPGPRPAPPAFIPLPGVERFETASFIAVDGKKRPITSWMDSFLYIDGRFRYLGRGAYAFWDGVKIRRADPCAEPGERTGGKLVKRVEPIYPAGVAERNVGEFVSAVLTVGKDGSVINVDILKGDPDLVDAARNAFLQWRYTPFISCGHAVEMSSVEHVNFPPSGQLPSR
jgi:hypothetical protein